MNDTLADRINALHDDELLRVVTVDADQYRPEALELALAEVERRKLRIPEELPAGTSDAAPVSEALRAFADGVASEFRPGRFTAAGRPVKCLHCAGETFQSRPALVNTRALTFFRLDWLNQGATVLVCEACGLLAWFRVPPDRVRD